jgi:predicted ester cyclase
MSPLFSLVRAPNGLDVLASNRRHPSAASDGYSCTVNVPDTVPDETLAAVAAEHRKTARRALEEVCSGKDLAAVEDVYSDRFVDHVNALEYRGTEGARRSVALYLKLFADLSFEVEEQVTERDRVASRWTLRGTHRGRRVELGGIVISRFEDGKIVEDWAASDTLELARQLGVWRSLLLLLKHGRLLREMARAGTSAS